VIIRRLFFLFPLLALSACQGVDKAPVETTSITAATGPLPPRERMPGTVATVEYPTSDADRITPVEGS